LAKNGSQAQGATTLGPFTSPYAHAMCRMYDLALRCRYTGLPMRRSVLGYNLTPGT